VQVHSLTARSISREFREGLRRNLPSHLDRNLHTAAGVTASSDGARDLSCGSCELFVTNGSRDVESGGSDCCDAKGLSEGDVCSGDTRGDNSFPGHVSDESGTQSLTPSVDGKCKLQNSIAFWEQLQRSGKWYTSWQLGTCIIHVHTDFDYQPHFKVHIF
jgi:hypothetical protein